MTGFPSAPDAQVTLANWQDPPFNRWAFRHMREIIPSQPIPAGSASPAPLPAASGPLPDPLVRRLDGSTATAAEVFADTCTDALVVLHDGRLVAERYDDGMTAATPHLLMSVSKSLVGCVAGVLADRGLLDPAALVTAYVPEAGSSGYAGATVRNLLDMRTGVAFRETYTELDAEVRVMERSMGWRPAEPGDPAGAYPYLTTLGQAGPHGGEFTYRSADTDMLVREAFAATDNEFVLPGSWYRNQFWVLPGSGHPVLACLGIHGQLVYADRATRTVVAKLSSWPDPQHTGYLLDTLRACAALATRLAAPGQ